MKHDVMYVHSEFQYMLSLFFQNAGRWVDCKIWSDDNARVIHLCNVWTTQGEIH